MANIIPIPALHDNYIWAIVHPKHSVAVVVDPGDAKPVIDFLKKENLSLAGILITHHHWDHTNGIDGLLTYINQKIPVYTPAHDPVSSSTHPLQDQDQIYLKSLDIELTVLDIPGHTKGHIAYVGMGYAFTGDTLFTAGCGRLFEGDAQQMHNSLTTLAALPEETLIYCGHEYTSKNLEFAKLVEPHNAHIENRIAKTKALRDNNKPTVPARLQLELETNPFLRTCIPEVQKNVSKHVGVPLNDPVSVFAALRQWKDNF